VPYAVSGNAWPHPNLVTISFVPDGTIVMGGVGQYYYSNMYASLDANRYFGSPTAWQNQILKAAQAWAQVTNINFAVVPDNGAPYGSGNYQQGDPGMGDIRIGGYNFGYSALAYAFQPPPVNNFSLAGDINFNTGQTFVTGNMGYDLFSVAVHEIGHALGMDHSNYANAVMYATYHQVGALNSDDVAGIQSIPAYGGARAADTVSNATFATATDITSSIDPVALTAVLPNESLSTTSDVDYYTFTVPSGTSGTLTATVQTAGLSLLAPKMIVYNSSQVAVGSASYTGDFGTTLTVTLTGVSAGQQYYIRVQPAVTTAFGTGVYALTLNLGSNPAPTVPLPNTQVLNGNPIQGGGGLADSPASDVFNIPTTTTLTAVPPVAVPTAGLPAAAVAAVNAGLPTPVADSGLIPSAATLSFTSPSAGSRTFATGPTTGYEADAEVLPPAEVLPVAPVPVAGVQPAAAALPDAVFSAPQAVPVSEAVVPAGQQARDAFFAGSVRDEANIAGEFGPSENGPSLAHALFLVVGGLALTPRTGKKDRLVVPEWAASVVD
jgi:hypothetical protein